MIVRIKSRFTPPLTTAIQAAGAIAFLAGSGLVGWSAYVVAASAFTQWAGQRTLAAEQREQTETIVPKSSSVAGRASTIPRGTVLGKVAIPRLGISYVLLEGTDAQTLDKSIGRVEGSARPGETGNIGIAGHRNTHFRKLEWVRRGDAIVVTAHNVEYRYLVEWVHLFRPDALQVLDASHGPAVTLITCFPFEYVGSAPLRFIVRALPDEATRAKLASPSPPTMAKR